LVRPSTTSRRTSNTSLQSLIDELPAERLENVLTHTSWAPDRASSYERLEFLGDSVLELAVARELYERYPDFTEGQMAKIRSHVVSRASCAVVAGELELGERMSQRAVAVPQEELDRLARNRNVLAALLEAALVVGAFAGRIEYALTTYVDHKTELQEVLARLGRSVTYTVLDVDGPPHDRTFTCAAIIDDEQSGIGKGASKKAAEQEAAREALAALGSVPPER